MIQSRQFLSDDKFFPIRIAVPNDDILVRHNDIGPFIAIDVRDCDAVANLNFGIDSHSAEIRTRRIRQGDQRTGDQQKQGCFHKSDEGT